MEKVYSNGTGGIYDGSSCIPQTLWASRVFGRSVESAADVFEDGAEYRQEVSQEIKYLMRITVEMSLEQES